MSEPPITNEELFQLLETVDVSLPQLIFSGIESKTFIYPCKFKTNGHGVQFTYKVDPSHQFYQHQLYAYVDLYEVKRAEEYQCLEEFLGDKRLSEHIIMTTDDNKDFKPIFIEMIQNGHGDYESELSAFQLIKTNNKGDNKRKMLLRKYKALQEHVGFLGNNLTDDESNIKIDNTVSLHMRSSDSNAYHHVCLGVHICRANNGKFESVNRPFYSEYLAEL